MAGGSDWLLDEKADALESWTRDIKDAAGSVMQVEHWYRETVLFVISKQVPASSVDLGAGDLGETSSSITCFVGGTVKQRLSISGRNFVCEADECRQEQPYSGYYLRRQVWRKVGADTLDYTENAESS